MKGIRTMGMFGSRRGAADKLSIPLMVLAFVAVGGFLYWLNITAQPTEVAIAEESTGATESGASVVLPMNEFLAGPGAYDGQVVEITGARVASPLGTQAFWIGPDDSPFLVRLGPQLLADSVGIPQVRTVNLVGTVRMMTDSILAVWDSAGAFPNEGDRMVAEFAIGSPFLEATAINTPGSGTSGEGTAAEASGGDL